MSSKVESEIAGKSVAKDVAGRGLRIRRLFTEAGKSPFAGIEWEKRTSRIVNVDGSVVFEMKEIEVPRGWSQLATDILASKYIRKAGVPGTGHETSARQVVTRIARTLRTFGQSRGYFADEANADAFEEELTWMLIRQVGSFNSPVWFNCGLAQEYGIRGTSVRNFYWDETKNDVLETQDAYTRPQLSACFIQSVQDDLTDLADLVHREMKLFKFGSGTGTNFSNIRAEGEKLSSGGSSSGLMSYLEIYDKAAGAIKSGGTTRRAAKMVILDVDHPEIERFIEWKAREEKKAKLLMEHGYSGGMDGEAYKTVSGQNSNNSVRVPDEFMAAVEKDGEWKTTWRTTGEVARTFRARDLFRKIAEAAWSCADPGMQFDTTINRWNPCSNTGRIRASNPCSEYMFLDDTACNLSSLNLEKFLTADGRIDTERYRHAISVFTLAQEIIVDFASYPTRAIARNSHDFRPLGLGYANLGAVLMQLGLPYDSDEGRAMAAALTAILCGQAYLTSSQIAESMGPFPAFAANREPFLNVMRMHRDAAYRIPAACVPEEIVRTAREVWDEAVAAGERNGYRNAQATVIAPTGTIGLQMDCDTTGIEPEYSLVKFKKLAGGGYFKIVNRSVPKALRRLGYTDLQIKEIEQYILGTGTLDGAPYINRGTLLEKGFNSEDLARIEPRLASAFDLSLVFSPSALGEETLRRLGISLEEARKPGFDLLRAVGFKPEQIDTASRYICGWQMIEGAPHLQTAHLPIFDCANRNGSLGKRFLSWKSQIRMIGAVQPFISGSISKTINMPEEATIQDVWDAYMLAWKEGLKCISIYRDKSKGVQVLFTKLDRKEENVAPEAPVPVQRRRLPIIRRGMTIESRVGGQKIYLRTGEYEDGSLGEIFIDMHKEGATYRSLMNCFAISISVGLQYGVPLKEYVDTFTFQRFDPQGAVEGHPNIKFATSVIDYIFRVLGYEYLGLTDFVQIKPEVPPKPKGRVELPPPVPLPTSNAAAPVPRGNDALLSEHLAQIQADAPFCNVCGHQTLRNGTCYRCLNCGNSIGCS